MHFRIVAQGSHLFRRILNHSPFVLEFLQESLLACWLDTFDPIDLDDPSLDPVKPLQPVGLLVGLVQILYQIVLLHECLLFEATVVT